MTSERAPDWLPEFMEYVRIEEQYLSDSCRVCYVNLARQAAHWWEMDEHFYWCDEPECKEKARRKITGGERRNDG